MQYLTLDNTSPRNETLIIQGRVLDKQTRDWVEVKNKKVPARSFICAGSIVEKTESQARAMLRMGVYTPAGTEMHFNLEDIFGEDRVPFGADSVDGKNYGAHQTSIAEVLRSHGIHTVEAIAENAMGTIPFEQGKIAVVDILGALADEGEVEAWIARAKEIVGQKAKE
jgi:hypothetical protein